MADSTNPYDSLVQQDTAQQLRVSMMDAVSKAPDTEAKLQTLAKSYNMPVDAVRLRQPEIEHQARLDAVDYDTLAQNYPKTSNMLVNPQNAAVAHDDVDNMSGLEYWAKYLFSHPSAKNTLMGDLGASLYQGNRGAAGVFQAISDAAAVPFDFLEQFTGMGGNPLRRLSEGFAQMGAYSGAKAQELSPPQRDVFRAGVSSGVQSFGQNALALPMALLPGGQAAALTVMSGQQGGQSYQEAREAGVGQWQALAHGTSQAVIEYATEKLPLHKLLGDVAEGTPLFKTLVHNAALEIPGEQVATVLQDLNDWATLHPDKPFSDYLAERPSAAAQTLIATLIGVGGNVTLTHAMQRAADNAAGTERVAKQAEARANVIDQMVKLAEASKLRERDPSKFAEFAQSLVEQDVPHIYIDAKALLKSTDINQVALALPSVAEQISEAAATGGDVVIPTQELLTAGPGNEFMQSLIDNARTAPEAMSPVEARTYMQEHGDQIKADIEKVLTQQEQDGQWRAMRDQVRDEFKAQLDQAKRFTNDVNNQYATLLANFYSVQAAKLGVTPQELTQRYPLQIRADGVAGGTVLDQSAWHGSPHNFDKFSTEHMGKGEGAQAFGWGMYFAGDKKVAKGYRESLAMKVAHVNGEVPDRGTPLWEAANMIASKGYDGALAQAQKSAEFKFLSPEGRAKAAELAKLIESLKDAKVEDKQSGALYKVDIPSDDKLLDWDKPLSEQPEEVRQAIAAAKPIKNLSGQVIAGEGASDMHDPTGSDIYGMLQAREGQEAASKYLHSLGIDGIKYLDGGSRADGEGTHNYVVFHDDAVKILDKYYQEARGSISLPDDITKSPSIISLFKGADLSTFIHESGHFFLEVQADLAARIQAQINAGASVTEGEREIVTDMDKTLAWMGVKGSENRSPLDTWLTMPLEEKRPFHEQWARGFEAYAFEGNAPSVELQGMFQKFRAWMLAVYKELKALRVTLTDDVRGVMDRMLASTQAIQEAEASRRLGPLFKTAEEAGMSLDEFKAYHALATEASQAAIDELQARGLRDMQWLARAKDKKLKEMQKTHDSLRKEVEREVRAEVMSQPVYRAWQWLTSKDEDSGKFNTQDLKNTFGQSEAVFWRPLIALRMTSEAKGIHHDLIAERFGFTSGDELIQAILAAEPPASVVEGMTDQRMLERYGDLGTPEGIARAADRAIHNDVRARFVASEIKTLEAGNKVKAPGLTGRATVDVLAVAARQQAERVIGGTKVRDVRPSQYTAAETRAARNAERAMVKGDTQEALAEKRHQIINLQATKEAMRAQDEIERTVKYLAKFADKPKGLDAEYYDQINALLERFDLRKATSLAEVDKRKTLQAWVESQREQGMEPEVPPELLNEAYRTSYKDLTVDELRGLRDTIKQIEHLGRLKNKLLTAKAAREFAAIRDEIADSITLHAGDRKADTRTPATALGRALKTVKDFGAAHIKAATLARILDGGKDGGPVWEYLVRSANERGDMETAERAKATEALHNILQPVLEGGKLGGKGQYFPSIKRSMNREQVLAMALNMGNDGNIQRMLGGEGWAIQQVEPVLATLTAADWRAVQAIWDHFETYRPQIAAKERRVYGKEPDWVQAVPLTVNTSDGQTVNLKGGYYPIKYDPLASNRAEQHNDAEAAKRQLQGAYTSATTRRGFTKSRVEEVKGRPLLYSLAGVYSGVNDVIHDLAWHEWLIDANKILRSDKIDGAIRDHYGPQAVRQFKTWVQDVAAGEAGLQAELDGALGKLRHGVSIAGLGFNVMSAVMQPLGLSQSIVRVGAPWIGKGLAQYIASPVGKTREVNSKSEFMAGRARTRFRELNELRNQVEGQHPAREVIGRYAYFLMMRCQQMVDTPTWLGAYEKAISQGNDEDRARALADQAVIDAQGGGQTKDLAAIERGGPAQKLFTVFYSFMNTALNIGVAQGMTEKSAAKKAADMLMLYSVPAVLGAILKDALTPGDSGDWDDWDKAMRRLLGEQLSYLFGLFVIAREFGQAALISAGLVDKARDYSGPAGLRLVADTYTLGKQVNQGEFDDSFRKALVNELGDLLGLPSAQVNRTINGAEALSEGQTDNPAALVFGYQQPH